MSPLDSVFTSSSVQKPLAGQRPVPRDHDELFDSTDGSGAFAEEWAGLSADVEEVQEAEVVADEPSDDAALIGVVETPSKDNEIRRTDFAEGKADRVGVTGTESRAKRPLLPKTELEGAPGPKAAPVSPFQDPNSASGQSTKYNLGSLMEKKPDLSATGNGADAPIDRKGSQTQTLAGLTPGQGGLSLLQSDMTRSSILDGLGEAAPIETRMLQSNVMKGAHESVLVGAKTAPESMASDDRFRALSWVGSRGGSIRDKDAVNSPASPKAGGSMSSAALTSTPPPPFAGFAATEMAQKSPSMIGSFSDADVASSIDGLQEFAPVQRNGPTQSGATQTVSQMARAPAPTVAAQIASALEHSSGQRTQIMLNPEELGRVRISLTSGEVGVIVNIVAERPETADLMRRNIDSLLQDFSELGYDNPSFEFEGQGQDTETGPEKPHSNQVGSDIALDQDINVQVARSLNIAPGGLDLKL